MFSNKIETKQINWVIKTIFSKNKKLKKQKPEKFNNKQETVFQE